MKLIKSLLLITMLAGVALAQAPSTPRAVAQQLTKTAAQQKTAPAVKPTMPATKPESVAAKHVTPKHVAKTHVAKKSAMPAKSAAVAEKTAEKTAATDATAEVSPEIKRGRDPFVSVIMERTGNVTCSGAGKKCLIVDQIALKGIVRSQGDAIAVVSSAANKTYFLRENDPVYNGVVVKITPDSIIFRETVTDRLGKSVQREVVKKVNNSAV